MKILPLFLLVLPMFGCCGCQTSFPDYSGSFPDAPPALTEPDGQINLAVGKFYTFSVEPMSGYVDEYPCLDYSDGTKLTDGEVSSSTDEGALGVGWRGAKSVELLLDLGHKRTIWSVKLHAIAGRVSTADFSLPAYVEVCGSVDKQSWSSAVMLTFDEQTGWGVASCWLRECRYLKFTIHAPNNANEPMLFDEMEAWGEYENEMKYVPQKGAYHGAFNNSTSFKGEEGSSACPVDLYEQTVGKPISLMLWYQGATNSSRNYAEIMNIRRTYSGKNFDGNYRLFIYGWEPPYSAAELAAGAMDEYYDDYFKEVRQVQRGDDDCGPAWFRPANEMNSNWVKWGNDAPNYVKYWRRMYNIAEQVGITDYNVFVWSSNAVSFGKYEMAEYYPGDQYCDWIGTSCYFTQAIEYGYPSQLLNETESISEHKPIMITEGGFGPAECDNLLWVREWFGLDVTHPRVKGVVWENHTSTHDRRIQKDADALELYKELVQDDYWLDYVPEHVLQEMAERKTRQNG